MAASGYPSLISNSESERSEDERKRFKDNAEDLSYSDLDQFPDFLVSKASQFRSLLLDHNQITILPRCIGDFTRLIHLNISNNGMTYITKEIFKLRRLRSLEAKNNRLDEENLPKEFSLLQNLQHLNLSGNNFKEFPYQITCLDSLRSLHLGGNAIRNIPTDIKRLKDLEILYMGGNRLRKIPESMGDLLNLRCLVLCDNWIHSLPSTLSKLQQLQSLSLHNNQLSVLPKEIVSLDLYELSLRNNPLIVRFVEDLVFQPPSLLEMAGRVIKVKHVQYGPSDLPHTLVQYLSSAQHCVNPRCKGVYFSSRIEHIKFVDFCGKFRLPLLEYLCSPMCATEPAVISSSESESDDEMPVASKLKKVLLG